MFEGVVEHNDVEDIVNVVNGTLSDAYTVWVDNFAVDEGIDTMETTESSALERKQSFTGTTTDVKHTRGPGKPDVGNAAIAVIRVRFKDEGAEYAATEERIPVTLTGEGRSDSGDHAAYGRLGSRWGKAVVGGRIVPGHI
jgi:hypothetical protein